mmetsp:Transcript_22494/g.49205  ORF Transcript_22494/g.49205 Transcript_22494/m.49205 type:complete len:220 (-) Transcript_22494:530-1189(-)
MSPLSPVVPSRRLRWCSAPLSALPCQVMISPGPAPGLGAVGGVGGGEPVAYGRSHPGWPGWSEVDLWPSACSDDSTPLCCSRCTLDPRNTTWQNSLKVTFAPCSCRSRSRSRSRLNSTSRSWRRPLQATVEMIPSTRSQRHDFTRSPHAAWSPASSYVDRTRCQGSEPAACAASSLQVTGSRRTLAVHLSGFWGSKTPGWAARDRRCWLSVTDRACTRA